MKRFSTLLFATLFVSLLAVQPLQAQDCEAYFPMKHGASFEMTSYNVKGKVESVVKTVMSEKESTAEHIVAAAHAVVHDDKGKEISSADYDVTCAGDVFKIDMRGFMVAAQPMPQGMEGMEMHIEADEMAFPKGLTVGTSLPDASVTIKATMSGMTIMNNTMKSTNRKVTAKESITTPSGSYNCILIESDEEGGVMGMHITTHSKSWYALGVGLVRQESYRNGKMESYQVLTAFSN